MTRKQAGQLGRVLIAWSEGAAVERRSVAEPGTTWQPFLPEEEGSIATFYQDWRIVWRRRE